MAKRKGVNPTIKYLTAAAIGTGLIVIPEPATTGLGVLILGTTLGVAGLSAAADKK